MTTTRGMRLAVLVSVCLPAFALALNLTSGAAMHASSAAAVSPQTKERSTQSDVERLRALARDLLDKKTDEQSIDRAAQLLQHAAKTENQAAQAAKYAVEEEKLKDDLAQSRAKHSSQEWMTYISMLAPLFTTLVLAGTLVQQSYQFKEQRKVADETLKEQRKDASAAAQRQIDAAEDDRWNEAIKVMAGQRLSPAGVLLATFSQSTRYGNRALDLATQLLAKSNSLEEFSATLGNLFEPVNWKNLKWILDADRSIYATYRRLDSKAWVQAKGVNDMNLLTPAERATYDLEIDEIGILAAKFAPLLKSQRPASVTALDLSATTFWRSDWKGVDLSGADLTNCFLDGLDLEGANFSGITRFQGSSITHCAWWNAATISPQLLDYLLEACPYKPGETYGSSYRPITPADFEAALQRLKQALSIHPS